MNVRELLEGYDPDHVCKTPDAIYSAHFGDNAVGIKVKLPKSVKLPEGKHKLDDLEADLHYAVEKVLAKLFK